MQNEVASRWPALSYGPSITPCYGKRGDGTGDFSFLCLCAEMQGLGPVPRRAVSRRDTWNGLLIYRPDSMAFHVSRLASLGLLGLGLGG